MAGPYRAPPPESPVACLRYYPTDAISSVVAVGVSVTLSALGVFAAVAIARARPPEPPLQLCAAASLAVGALVPLLALLRHTRVAVDRVAGTLVLSRIRWPQRAVVRSFPLDRVRRVRVESYEDEGHYMVVLDIDGQPPVKLVEGLWPSGEAKHEEAAAAIRAMLGSARPEITTAAAC